MACYHIRWSDSRFDWECHATRAEAESSAKELVKDGETFAVVLCDNGEDSAPCPLPEIQHKLSAGQQSA